MQTAVQICKEHMPQGIMFLGSNLDHFRNHTNETHVPCLLVTTGASALNFPELSSIAVDDSAAAAQVIEHFISCGHKNIGIIGGDPAISRPSFLRMTGCRAAFDRNGLAFDTAKQYAYARFSLKGGYLATKELLQKFPEMTAIFAISDLMALGAYRALNESGLRIPEDISVVGFDGIELSKYVVPKLATIRQNADKLAERSVDIMLRMIRGECGAVHEVIPFEVIAGESVRTIRQEE